MAYQYDALASLIFNIGQINYTRSTLRRYVKSGAHIRDIIVQIARWRYYTTAKGEKLISPGLSSRREDEARQYFGDAATLRKLGYPPYKTRSREDTHSHRNQSNLLLLP